MEKAKQKVLEKLEKKGFDTEKKINSIDLQAAVDHGFTIDEASIILALQKVIKSHNVISFLLGGTDEKPEKKEVKHDSYERYGSGDNYSGE